MAKVRVYEHANYVGQGQSLSPGRYQTEAIALADNTISSIQLPPGWKVTLWTDNGFSGASFILTGDSPSLVNQGFNDVASSITVTSTRDDSIEESTGSLGFLNIPGANTWVNVGPVSLDFGATTRGFTFEAWVWFDSCGYYSRIFDFFQTAGVDNILLCRETSTSNLSFYVAKAGAVQHLSASAVIENGQWMHVAVTLDPNGNARIYCKGTQVASGVLLVPDNLTRGSAWLGRSPWGGDAFFAGQMTEVRIWNVTRSADEIKRTMGTRLTGTEAGLFRYFRMDEKSTCNGWLQDLSGHNPAAVGGTALYSLSGPKLAQSASAPGGLSFDGVTDHLKLPTLNADFSNGFTLEAWVYHDSVAMWSRIFDLGNGIAKDNIVLARSGTSNNLNLSVYKNGIAEWVDAIGCIGTGSWQHFAVTVDAPAADGRGTVNIYLGGVLYTVGRIALPSTIARSVCYVGKSAWPTDALFKGRMAELRIWNRVRTPEQLQAATYQRLDPKEPGLVAYYPLDERASTYAHDVSPSGLDAQVQTGIGWNCPLPSDFVPLWPPSTSLVFNGTDTYLQLPPIGADFSQGLTLEAWVYFDSAASFSRIFELGNGPAADNVIVARSGVSNDLVFWTFRGATVSAMNATNVLGTGRWMHIAATLDTPAADGTGVAAIYLNGVLKASGRLSLPYNLVRKVCYVGKSAAGDPLFKGNMAELRIWTRARSQAEVRDAMNRRLVGNEPGLHLYYPLSETSGQLVNPQLADNKSALPPWPVANTMAFNGVDTFVPLPSISADFSTGFTIEAWVNFGSGQAWPHLVEMAVDRAIDAIVLHRDAGNNSIGLSVTAGGASSYVLASNVFVPNAWFHVAATLDSVANGSGVATIYVNGQPKGQGPCAAPSKVTRGLAYIGKSSTPWDPLFLGRMTEVRIWTRARTQAELLGNLNVRMTGKEPGLCIYRAFNDPPVATILGRYGRILADSPITTSGALGFDGVDDAVQLPALSSDLSTGFSLELWLYLDDLDGASACILDLATASGTDRLALSRDGNAGDLLLQVISASGVPSVLRAPQALKSGQWMHVGATLGGVSAGTGQAVLYVNGVSCAAGSVSAPRNVVRDSSWVGRASAATDGRLRGRCTDLRIFSRGRTQTDIQAGMKTPCVGSELGLVRYYPLDEVSEGQARDLAQQNGMVVGPADWDSVPSHYTRIFDGVDSYIPLSNFAGDMSTGFTIEAWVMFRGRDTSTAVIDLGAGCGVDNILIASELTTNNLRLYVFAASYGYLEAVGVITDYTWMHIAVTMGSILPDGTGFATVYVNGEAKVKGRLPAPRNVPRPSSFIGKCNWPGYRLFRGRMSEVRIWTICRTQDQIRTMMRRQLLSSTNGLYRNFAFQESAGIPYERCTGRYAITMGSADQGALFNGRTDWVQLPTILAESLSSFTLEARVYFAGNESWGRIFDLGNGTSTDNVILARSGTSSTLALVVYNSSGISSLNAPNVIVNGQWMHVAATYVAGGSACLYVNGVLVATGPLGRPNMVDRTLCFLGKSNWSVDPLFRGAMAEVRIFNVARTQAQIDATKFGVLTGSEPGLRFYYRFADQPGWKEQNLAYPNDGWRRFREATLIGTQADTQPLTPGDGSLRFDGRTSALDLPGQRVDLSQGLTLEAWVCFSGVAKDDEVLIAFGDGTYGTSVVLWRKHSADRLVISVGRAPSLDSFRFAQPRIVETWMHLAVTVDASRLLTVYVNGDFLVSGALDATDKKSIPTDYRSRLGMGLDSNGPFQGRLKEVRLWNYMRSGADIFDNRSKWLPVVSKGLIRYYPLNQEFGSIAYDPNDHPDATIIGAPQRFPRRLTGSPPSIPIPGGLEFNGSTTYVVLPPIRADFSHGFAFEAWVYFDGVQRGARIIELGRGEQADNISIGRLEDSGALSVQVANGGQVETLITSNVIVDRTWMHIAVVFVGFVCPSIYVNGVLQSTTMTTSPGIYTFGFLPNPGVVRNKNYLGKSAADLPLFKGKMAEVRLWRRVRTVAEIQVGMGGSLCLDDPALVAYYRLDEQDGTRAHDASNARLDADVLGARAVWNAPAPYFLPPPSQPGALTFGGASDWVELPAITADFSTGFAVEGWFYFGGNEPWIHLVSLSTGWNLNFIVLYREASNNNLGLAVRDSANGSYVVAYGVIQVGKWIHIAATLENVVNGTGTATIYIDGEAKAQGSCMAPPKVTRNLAYLGKSPSYWDVLFAGKMAEVRIWNIGRSATDINRCKNTRLSGSENGLVAYYRLNETDGERAGDASRNRLHAAVRGHASWSQSAPLPSVQSDGGPTGILRMDAATWSALPPIVAEAAQTVPLGFCLEAWVWCSDVTKSGQFIALGNGSASDGLYLGHSGSALVFGVQVGTQPVQVVTFPSALSSKQWTHVAASIDENGHVCLCKDGQPVQADKFNLVAPSLLGRSLAQIGRSLTGVLFDGYLAEVRIWTTPRSPRQVVGTRFQSLGGSIPGLAGCYPMKGTRGFVVTDTSDKRRDGTVFGSRVPQWDGVLPPILGAAAALPAAVSPGALSLDGASTYVRLPACTSDLSCGFTFEATLRADTTAPVGAILDVGNGSAGDNIQITIREDRRLSLRIYTGTTSYTEVLSVYPFFFAGNWAQFSITVDSQRSVSLYQFGTKWDITVDGVSTSTLPIGRMPQAGVVRSVCYLGKSSVVTQRPLQGLLLEVRLWNRGCTNVEVGTNWSKQLSGAEPGLVGLYSLTETQGRTARSAAPGLGDGTVFGDVVWGVLSAPLVYTKAPTPLRTVPDSVVAPAGALPIVGWQDVDPATVTVTTWSGSVGVDSGDVFANTALSLYATSGLQFSLLGVSAKVTFAGQVSVRPMTSQVALSLTPSLVIDGTYSVSLPQTTLTLTKGSSPMIYTLSFSPVAPLSVVSLVRSAVKDPLLASTFDVVLAPFLNLISDGTVLVSNKDGIDPVLGAYVQGMTLFVKKAMSELPVLNLIHAALPQLGLSSRLVVLSVALRDTVGYKITAAAKLNIKLLNTGPVSLEFNELGIQLSSAETTTALGVTHRFTLTLLGETLLFRGGVTLEQTGGTSAVSIWGALDPSDVRGSTWKNPWGLPGLEIGGFGVQVKGGTAVGIGCRGEIHIGDGLLGGTVALNIDTANPILLVDSPEGLDLPRLISAFLPGVKDALSALTVILAIRLKELKLYFAPQGGEIAGQRFDKGVSVGASLDLWGYRAKIFGRLDATTGAVLKGQADRIKVDVGGVTLLQFSDASGNSGPSVDVALTAARQGVFYSGQLRLLGGVYQGYEELAVGSDGIAFRGASPLGALSLAFNWQSGVYALTMAPRFAYSFEALGIPVSIDVGAEVSQRVDSTGFRQSLRFWFRVCGVGFDVGPVTWGVPLVDIKAIGEVFESFFGDQVKSFFEDTLAQGLKQAFEWVRDNLTNIAEEAIELFKTAGAVVADIAKNVFATFDTTAHEVINFLGGTINEAADLLRSGLNLAADEAAEVLGAAYGVGSDAVKAALSFGGYAATEISNIASTVWDDINSVVGYLDPTDW